MPSACGQAVHPVWALLVQVGGVMHASLLTASAWVQVRSLYQRLSNFCTQLVFTIVDSFTSVMADLSSLYTGPITTTTNILRRL
jgi:hypothetical protein